MTGSTAGDGTAGWPADERELLVQLNAGSTVVAHRTRHRHLVAWAKAHGRFVRVDRRTAYGNPFHVGTKPGQFSRAGWVAGRVRPSSDVTVSGTSTVSFETVDRSRATLRGKVLGCWCAPKPCHGHVLAEAADGSNLEVPVPQGSGQAADGTTSKAGT